jgi:hypothetical protein
MQRTQEDELLISALRKRAIRYSRLADMLDAALGDSGTALEKLS